jgi:hypothetical protein
LQALKAPTSEPYSPERNVAGAGDSPVSVSDLDPGLQKSGKYLSTQCKKIRNLIDFNMIVRQEISHKTGIILFCGLISWAGKQYVLPDLSLLGVGRFKFSHFPKQKQIF